MVENAYQVPALFYILCAMSAMAFITCSAGWFVRALRSDSEYVGSFSLYIWAGQAKNFLFVLIISIVVGVYDYFLVGQPVYIMGEVSILCCVYLYFFLRHKRSRAARVMSFTKSYLLLGLGCLVGWGITVGFGFVLMTVLQLVSAINSADFFVMVIFITGMLWNAPVLMLYQKVLKDAGRRSVLEGQGFHKFLWPVLLAYLILLIPLMIQQKVDSEEWQEMLRAKPMRQVFIWDIANPPV